MSAEQEKTFQKFRDANDPGGNLGWSSRMARKAMLQAAEAPPGVEDWEMSDEEKVLWRLMKIPRKYIDLENTGVMPAEKARGFLRGLVSADVLDIVELDQAKPIVPLEVKRHLAKLSGQDAGGARPAARLKARVYRPDISGTATSPSPAAATPPASAPAPVEGIPPPQPARVAPKPITGRPVAQKPKPAADTPRESSPRGDEIVANVTKLYAAMKGQNHYEFLDIQPSAQPEGIKKAYMKLAKELHPDRFAGTDLEPDVVEKADKLFKRLQNAWSTLNNEAQRRQYDQQIKAGNAVTDGEGGGKVRRPEEAKVMFLKAEHLAKAKQWQQAEQHYKTAFQLDDQLQAARVGLGWAIYYNEGRDRHERVREAKTLLDELVNRDRNGDAAYKLALIARLEGNDDEHERRIMQATKLSPKHQEAMQERRLIERRKGPEPKVKGTKGAPDKGGLFGRLKR